VIRFYMINLVRRQKRRETVRKTVMEAFRWQKEIIGYLQSFGAEHVQMGVHEEEEVRVDRADVGKEVHQLMDFWHFPKDVILDTICMCAKALKSVEPFNEHPANRSKVLPQKCFDEFSRIPRRLGKEMRLTLQAEIKQSGIAVSRSVRRMSYEPRPDFLIEKEEDDEDAVEHEDAVTEVKSFDFDDLDDPTMRFSPRLMELIVEEFGDKEDSTLSPGDQIFSTNL